MPIPKSLVLATALTLEQTTWISADMAFGASMPDQVQEACQIRKRHIAGFGQMANPTVFQWLGAGAAAMC
jgi:hypothetical protein